MTPPSDDTPALIGREIRKTFRRDTGEIVVALDGVSLEVRHGAITALVGPDGAGKTTLIRLAAGLMAADSGQLTVLGFDAAADPQKVQDHVGYMPQRFGLYEDLSVQENLDLYADMHAISAAMRRERYPRLMEMTALGPFTKRLAGQLSGGMKQKLGLACTLIGSPDLLLLDEPTVGVDPLSRRELWEIILQLVQQQGLTVLLSTSYLDEAERCDHVVVLREGKVLAQGPPAGVSANAAGRTFLLDPAAGTPARDLQAHLLDNPSIVDAVPESGRVRIVLKADIDHSSPANVASVLGLPDCSSPQPTDATFEDGFMVLLHRSIPTELNHSNNIVVDQPLSQNSNGPAVEVHNLVRKFGSFTAVDHISFDVRRGEIFGLLGPNGAGKTTTFRMLCGLLPATSGTLRVAGVDLLHAAASARQRIGYVAQKFSLYGQLTVVENLEFFASAYGLGRRKRRERIAWAMRQFELASLGRLPSGQLPGGYKQRLAMAAALLHEPEILFLDEPTSGADPLARRDFWRRITALAKQGVTIIVTTHFMAEAGYCDRIVILDAGKVLAQGTPAEVRLRGKTEGGRPPTMEDAFISIVAEGRGNHTQTNAPNNGNTRQPSPDSRVDAPREPSTPHVDDRVNRTCRQSTSAKPREMKDATNAASLISSTRRVWSLIKKEGRQIVRDPSSIAIGLILPLILILLFGFGLSLDVTDIPVAVVLEDPSPQATELAAGFTLSPYFNARRMTSMPQARQMLLNQEVDGIVRIRPDFGRRLVVGNAEVQILVNGTDSNRARIIQAYAEAAIGEWAAHRSSEGRAVLSGPVVVEDRLWFNEANESRWFLVPGLIVLVMTLIGALLTTLVMAREWERGTLEAIFVTPVRTGEILLGKTIPYFALGMTGLILCLLSARFLFHVPFRGSVAVLCGASMLYLLVALGIGLMISSVTKSQFVASQLTMLITFLPAFMLSGFLFDIRSMPAMVRLLTFALPARYYVALLQTIFLAGDVWAVVLPNAAVLAAMAVVLLILARLATRKRLA
jgi:ABC-2 type transport system permease protein